MLNGNLEVPSAFVIPIEELWSGEIWNIKLGTAVCNKRSRETHKQHYGELKAMGFRFKNNGES